MSKKLQIVGALKIPQSDWNQTDDTQLDYIKNKPDIDSVIADAFNDFAEKVSDDKVVNTYKELIDYAATHSAEFTELVGEVTRHTTNTNNPHKVDKSDVGLGNVANTGDSATPVSGGTTKFTTGGAYTELNKKVDKVSGKGLSTNDFTNDYKAKVDSALQSYTETDPTVPDWAKQPTKPTYSASEVGALPNTTKIPTTLKELTGDATHRVVTDTEKAAWNAKSDFSGSYTDLTDKPAIPTVPTDISAFNNDKGYLTYFDETDPTVPSYVKNITTDDISNWNAKSTFSGSYNDLTNKPDIPSKVSDLDNDKGYLTAVPSEYITETELAAKKYLTSVPSEYVTETELNNKGYLTQHQSLAGFATETYVDNKVANFVDSAPEALDTLNELAAALGDDPNFAATVATEIGKKVDKVSGKGLSTNDYTTDEKNKLAGIESGANKYSHPSTHPADMIEGLSTVATSGKYSDLSGAPTSMTPTAHNQASNTINAMTNYSKPSSTSAISTSDTLNGAIGKLEKALDGKQASGSYVTTNNTGVQSIAGGLVVGGASATATSKGRIMITGHTNPLIGLQAIDADGNQLTPYYFQVANDVMYIGPTSSRALAFDSNGNTTVPASLAVTGAITEGGKTLSSKYLTAHPAISVEEDSTSASSPEHGNTFTAVDSITRDDNGHVIKVNTKTVTVPDAGLHFIPSDSFTVVAGSSTSKQYLATKWAVSDVDGITSPSDGMSIALRAPDVGYNGGILLSIDGGSNYYPIVRNVSTLVTTNYSTGSTIILTFNSTQTAKPYLTSGVQTEVTGCWQIADYDSNSYAYVRQYYTTTDANYPLLFKYDAGLTETKSYVTKYTRTANNMYVNPSTGEITANGFIGALTGNADTATKATQDANGNVISDTYATQQALLDSLSAIEAKLDQLIGGEA